MSPSAQSSIRTEGAEPTRVRLAPDFVRRLETLVQRVAAARDRREGPGRRALGGGGDEFVGHRPYRPGEDLRNLDWLLLARLERPFVRVLRREAGERWTVLLDTSASMGLGRPGKLQRAAEVASGLAFVGLRSGAVVQLVAGGERDRRPEAFVLRKRADLGGWLAFLEQRRAAGRAGLSELAADPRLAGARRIFALGDLGGVAPADLLPLARRGRALSIVQLLAPHELLPEQAGAAGREVEWLDPESEERLDVELTRGLARRYEQALEARLESWRLTCARHGAGFGTWSSARPFEALVRAVLEGER